MKIKRTGRYLIKALNVVDNGITPIGEPISIEVDVVKNNGELCFDFKLTTPRYKPVSLIRKDAEVIKL